MPDAPATNPIHLRRDAPARPPDWRWQLAQGIRAGSWTTQRGRYDEAVDKFGSMLLKLQLCRDDWDRLELYEQDHESRVFGYAWDLHQSTDKKIVRMRDELQARIMTELDLDGIGKPMGISADVVGQYEAMFFNVRDRIEQQSWVLHHVIGEPTQYGLTERNTAVLWKVFGYRFGSAFLEGAINLLPRVCVAAEDVASARNMAMFDLMHWKALIAAAVQPVNSITCGEILTQIIALQKTIMESGQTGTDRFLSTMGDILDKIPWSVRPPTAQLPSVEQRVLALRPHEEIEFPRPDVDEPAVTLGI